MIKFWDQMQWEVTEYYDQVFQEQGEKNDD